MPYHKKATHEELLELLPHKWKLQHPESALTLIGAALVLFLIFTNGFERGPQGIGSRPVLTTDDDTA